MHFRLKTHTDKKPPPLKEKKEKSIHHSIDPVKLTIYKLSHMRLIDHTQTRWIII